MGVIRKYDNAVKAIKKNIYAYQNITDKLKDDARLLIYALVEIEKVQWCADPWDMLYFGTSHRLQPYFVKVVREHRFAPNQVTVLIDLIVKCENLDLPESVFNKDNSFEWGYYS